MSIALEDPKLTDEPGRVAALHRYEILDTQPEESFDRITNLVKMILQVPISTVSLIDTDRQWLKSAAGVEGGSCRREDSFCTHTIKTREPMNIGDSLLDPRFVDNIFVTGPPHIRAYLGVPLRTPEGYNVGSLCAIDTKPRDFTPEQLQVLSSFAALVVDELELRRIAQTDALTGAATRRGFSVELEKQISRMKRSDRPSSLIMLDVDHFKNVNDTYGHPAGDAVLRNLAQKIQSSMRQGDVFGRLGGEEFAILMPDTSIEDAADSANRLRLAIAEKPLVTDPEIPVTISLGVSAQTGEKNDAQWLAISDAALYEAKRTGRNKVCIA